MSKLSGELWIVLGTRPEAIKQIPLFLEARNRWGSDKVKLVSSGQHPDLLQPIFEIFDVSPDFELKLDGAKKSLAEMSAGILAKTRELFQKQKPESIVVQGDTSTAAMIALAAFYEGDVSVVHNEAGLRSGNNRDPFPEELNRRMIASIADLHLAPTSMAQEQLHKEGVDSGKIVVCGNTGIDSLMKVLEMATTPQAEEILAKCPAQSKMVLLTAHRRENRGESFEQWFKALNEFLNSHPDLFLVYPQHPNAFAREACEKYLGSSEQVLLSDPLDYRTTAHLLKHCAFVVTDSGGLQEEGCTLSKPVVVCRETTERMEAVDSGWAQLAGTQANDILRSCEWAKALAINGGIEASYPYGKGQAAKVICDFLETQNL